MPSKTPLSQQAVSNKWRTSLKDVKEKDIKKTRAVENIKQEQPGEEGVVGVTGSWCGINWRTPDQCDHKCWQPKQDLRRTRKQSSGIMGKMTCCTFVQKTLSACFINTTELHFVVSGSVVGIKSTTVWSSVVNSIGSQSSGGTVKWSKAKHKIFTALLDHRDALTRPMLCQLNKPLPWIRARIIGTLLCVLNRSPGSWSLFPRWRVLPAFGHANLITPISWPEGPH